MKQWTLFGLSIGFLLVLMSSTLAQGSGVLVSGLVLILVCGYSFFKGKGK